MKPVNKLILVLALFFQAHANEIERIFRVSESFPSGELIGTIYGQDFNNRPKNTDTQNYFVIFPDPNSDAEKVVLKCFH